MNKSDEAKELFKTGFNCAQSVLFTFGKDFFIDKTNALKITAGFGAGISYRGEICGAVTGSLMAIGLHFGYVEINDDISNERTYSISKEFIESFEKKHGSLFCNKLLECEINTPKGIEYATSHDLFSKRCPCFIESACEILENLIQKES